MASSKNYERIDDISEQECSNCRFYISAPSRLRPNDGLCRLKPPTVVVCDTDNIESAQPYVRDSDWCGEWRGKQIKGKEKR